MPVKKKSQTKSDKSTAQDLLKEWTEAANRLKQLEEEKKELSNKLESITSQLVNMDFSIVESSTVEEDDATKNSKKSTKAKSKIKKTTKTTKADKTKVVKETKSKKSSVKKSTKKQAKKPVMIATESTGSDTDSDTDSDSD